MLTDPDEVIRELKKVMQDKRSAGIFVYNPETESLHEIVNVAFVNDKKAGDDYVIVKIDSDPYNG